MAELDRESGDNWGSASARKVALAAIQEQRRARHWSIFFKLLCSFTSLLCSSSHSLDGKKDSTSSGKHTAWSNCAA